MLRWSAEKVHELLVAPSITEVNHASEAMRERGLEARTEICVDLLSEVREAMR